VEYLKHGAARRVPDVDLGHLSPALFEHINPYGRYRFDLDSIRARAGLRPLRRPVESP
jgi:hypothetical protein